MKKYCTLISDGVYRCDLCPRFCQLKTGDVGFCLSRMATEEGIELKNYGEIVSASIEPVEKKPFYHFLPGEKTFSFGLGGCQLRCPWCQNYKISQEVAENCSYYSPHGVVNAAQKNECKIVCMTYTEPTIHYEFIVDLAERCKKNNLRFVIKTNAYVNEEPWNDILQYVDAVNIDYKGDNSIIGRIQQAIKTTHVEISIPVHSDISYTTENIKELRDILAGDKVPCHCLKIIPAHQVEDATSNEKVFEFRDFLLEKLPFVYAHNIFNDEGIITRHTTCPTCKNVIVRRNSLSASIQFSKNCTDCKSWFML